MGSIANISIDSGFVSCTYGGGDDGAADFDGTNTFAAFASKSGSTYTLTRDVALAGGSFVRAGVTLKTATFKLFCNGKLTIEKTAVVSCDGNNAALGVAGAVTSSGTLGLGTAGGAGSAGVGVGAAGTAQSNVIGNGTAGTGGAGGAGGADAGGAGGAYTPAYTGGLASTRQAMSNGYVTTGTTGQVIGGGAGGGGGGADNAGVTGGGGGGGGGVMMLHAYNLVCSGAIHCRGGNGAAASGSGGNGGGGGGGKGGVILQLSRFRSFDGDATIDCNGGSGGAALGGSGVAGAAGAAGTVMQRLAE